MGTKTKKIIKFEDKHKIENIEISDHAIERFEERKKKLNIFPGDTIKYHLENSIEEDLGVYRVFRLMNNDYIDAEYFIHEGWRFVICKNKVVTIERVKKEEN